MESDDCHSYMPVCLFNVVLEVGGGEANCLSVIIHSVWNGRQYKAR